MESISRYDSFVQGAKADFDKYIKECQTNGIMEYNNQVNKLIELSNKLNGPLLVYLFGQQIGEHLGRKFVYECNRNLLQFFSKINDQQRFYILHQLKTDEMLFLHC